jgi:hypothetical protein
MKEVGYSLPTMSPASVLKSLQALYHLTTGPQLSLLAIDHYRYHRLSWLSTATDNWPKSESKLCYYRQSVGQSVSLSRVQHPSGAEDQIFITVRQLYFYWYGAPSLTRGRVCSLQLLLALVSAVIFTTYKLNRPFFFMSFNTIFVMAIQSQASQLLYDWRFTANQFVLALSSLRLPTIFQGPDERFPWIAQTEVILPAHIVWMELNPNRLPDDAIHVSGFLIFF